MSPALPALNDFSDRLSPMVVKEMRQGLRTITFTATLILFHVVLGCLMIGFLTEWGTRETQTMFWTIISVVLLGIMPAQGFNTLHGESQTGTLDMLRLTGITSFRIVWGKWVTLFSQTLLITASLLPYLIARYFMGGVEIAAEALALVLLLLWSGIVTAAVVAFSTQRSIWIKLFAGGAAALPTFYIGAMAVVMTTDISGQRLITPLFNLELWQQCLILAGFPMMAGILVFQLVSLGASRIASAAEDHGSMKRLVMLVVMTMLMLLGIYLSQGADWENAFWIFIPMMVLSIVFGMDVTTESMPAYPCVMSEVAARHPRLRFMHRLLYPGWASGTLCYAIIVIETLVLFTVMMAISSTRDGEAVAVAAALLGGVVVPLCINTRYENRFAHWWVVQALTLAASVLLGLAGAVSGGALSAFGLFTPITALVACTFMMTSSLSSDILFFAGIVSFFWLVAAFAKAITEYQVYESLEKDVERLKSTSPVIILPTEPPPNLPADA